MIPGKANKTLDFAIIKRRIVVKKSFTVNTPFDFVLGNLLSTEMRAGIIDFAYRCNADFVSLFTLTV